MIQGTGGGSAVSRALLDYMDKDVGDGVANVKDCNPAPLLMADVLPVRQAGMGPNVIKSAPLGFMGRLAKRFVRLARTATHATI